MDSMSIAHFVILGLHWVLSLHIKRADNSMVYSQKFGDPKSMTSCGIKLSKTMQNH